LGCLGSVSAPLLDGICEAAGPGGPVEQSWGDPGGKLQ